ncbi:MAG: DUF3604 domain-containing protein [Oceanospirillaceae bacterium]|nr:DUF3604 domain-containing protein [Oceanospirillaceae bacterium]
MNSTKRRALFSILAAFMLTIIIDNNTTANTPKEMAGNIQLSDLNIAITPPKNAYFDQLAVHSSASPNVLLGDSALSLDQTYRFANRQTIKIGSVDRNSFELLDFMTLADHWEYSGERYSSIIIDAPGHNHEMARQLLRLNKITERDTRFKQHIVIGHRFSTSGHCPLIAGHQHSKTLWPYRLSAPSESLT